MFVKNVDFQTIPRSYRITDLKHKGKTDSTIKKWSVMFKVPKRYLTVETLMLHSV